jgi:hypothetical protein
MNREQIADVVQMATGIALVLGLVLVLWELRQAKSLTLAELTSQAFSEQMEEARTVMGEHPATAIAKACNDPESVTKDDLIVLQAYYGSVMSQIWRLRILEDVEDFGVQWQSIAREGLIGLLSTEHGRWWFAENVARDAELAAIGDEILALDPSCADYMDRFGARAAQQP